MNMREGPSTPALDASRFGEAFAVRKAAFTLARRSTSELARPPVWNLGVVEADPSLAAQAKRFARHAETAPADQEARIVRETMIVIRAWASAGAPEAWLAREREVQALLGDDRAAPALASLLPAGSLWQARFGGDGICEVKMTIGAARGAPPGHGDTLALALSAALFRAIAWHCGRN
ncbi:hypothetical protein SAMN05518801_102403 [Novosphingobium sp. CF614]|uniref:hypothetical protein n=1 Tax=Novosphingobium sp. CF614 TaxID=1884364 RepID=UPI0008E82ED5|nr:hypothetical protein [Novosphingobium sp. CF614]SFF88002.1 hypothetical protein SAMN05518801_102403 [Novosphingobium sp. CF614]